MAEGDPIERVWLFGGEATPDGNAPRDGTWLLEFDAQGDARWSEAPLANDSLLPTGRVHAVAAWDAVSRRMLVYGCRSAGTHLSDFWELRLGPGAP